MATAVPGQEAGKSSRSMAGTAGSLAWLEHARFQIENAQEWKDFTAKLFDAVQQQMTENHVNFFTDLSETEKTFVLERAARAIRGGDLHNALIPQISACLEEHIYSHVAVEMQDGHHTSKSKSDLVLGHLRGGVMNLLEKRPDLKGKLHALFNQPLPPPLRGRAWKLYLSNTKARMEYLSKVAANTARSTRDQDISLKCLSVLSAEPTLQHLKDNKVATRTMRNALSYSHKIGKVSIVPSDAECLLIVPLVQVVLDNASVGTSMDSLTTLLVEEYLTFLDLRPQFMRFSPDQDTTGVSGVFEEVALMLQQKDQELAASVQATYSKQAGQPEESLQRAIQSMLQPVMQRLFTGYLQMKTVLFVWDQYILGLDQPTYNCLPAFSFAFLLLLRDHLKGCHSPIEAEAVLKNQGPMLSTQEFQDMINKHFYRELYSTLNKEDTDPIVIHDLMQAVPQWSYATRRAVLPRAKPQDRRQAREEREMLRRQHMEKLKEEENLRLQRVEEQTRQEELRMERLLEDTMLALSTQMGLLEDQLSQEKQVRYEVQKEAEDQIAILQAEVVRLREMQRRSPDLYSIASVTAPPPSLHCTRPSTPRLPYPPPPPPGSRAPAEGDGPQLSNVHEVMAETGTRDSMN